ncbi:MAG: hypothetical protein ACLQVK_01115 [Acidimicrobiales bacterium]
MPRGHRRRKVLSLAKTCAEDMSALGSGSVGALMVADDVAIPAKQVRGLGLSPGARLRSRCDPWPYLGVACWLAPSAPRAGAS